MLFFDMLRFLYLVHFFSTSDQKQMNTSRSNEFTFLPSSSGKSFVEYRRQWPAGQGQSLSVKVSFMTSRSDALLFHHTYFQESLSVKEKPHLITTLRNGKVRVEFIQTDQNINVTIDKGRSQSHINILDYLCRFNRFT